MEAARGGDGEPRAGLCLVQGGQCTCLRGWLGSCNCSKQKRSHTADLPHCLAGKAKGFVQKAVDQPSPWVPLFPTSYNPAAFAAGLTLLPLPFYSSLCSHPCKRNYWVANSCRLLFSGFGSSVNNNSPLCCSLLPRGAFSFLFCLQLPDSSYASKLKDPCSLSLSAR